MADFDGMAARLNSVAVSRLGGEAWTLEGVPVTVIYDARFTRVNFGDERYKNVDMTGVGINSTGPVLRLATVDLPEGVTKGSGAVRVADDVLFKVISVEHDNGITLIRIKREAY